MSFLAEVMVHTGLFLGFLPLFFFLFVAPIQSNSLTNDFFNMLTPLLDGLSLDAKNPNVDYKNFSDDVQELENVAEGGLSSFTNELITTNTKIKKIVTIVVGVLSPLLIIAGCIIEVYSGGNLTEFLIANLIVLVFIALSEFAIVGLFLRSFVEIDSGFVRAIFSKKMADPYGGCWYTNSFIRSILPAWLANMFLQTPPRVW
jgi:hypothetical protein